MLYIKYICIHGQLNWVDTEWNSHWSLMWTFIMESKRWPSMYNTVGLKYIQSLVFGKVAVTFQCITVLGDGFKDFAPTTILKNTNRYLPAYLNTLTLEHFSLMDLCLISIPLINENSRNILLWFIQIFARITIWVELFLLTWVYWALTLKALFVWMTAI